LKATEIVEGETYALEVAGQDHCVPVTVTSKTPGKVKVRSDRTGAEVEVPSRRIRSSWRDYRAGKVQLVSTRAFDDVAWLPEPGAKVERDDAPGAWTVAGLNLLEGKVEVEGELVSLPRTETVSLDRVHPAEPGPASSSAEIDVWVARADRTHRAGDAPAEAAADESQAPRNRAESIPAELNDTRRAEIAKRLWFGPTACEQYRTKVEPRCQRGDEAVRMRREIKNWSQARVLRSRNRLKGEFIRYVVPARFAVVLFDEPRNLPYDIDVDRIIVLKQAPLSSPSKKARNRRNKRRRR
jgi:hypothetical protein